jgi:hypothetical protein
MKCVPCLCVDAWQARFEPAARRVRGKHRNIGNGSDVARWTANGQVACVLARMISRWWEPLWNPAKSIFAQRIFAQICRVPIKSG